MDQRNERCQDCCLLTPMDGCGACENPGGLVLEFAFEPEPTRGVYELLHLRTHVALAGRGSPSDPVCPAQIVVRDRMNVGLLCPHECRPAVPAYRHPEWIAPCALLRVLQFGVAARWCRHAPRALGHSECHSMNVTV